MGNAISSGTKYCTSFVVGKAKYILQLEDNLEALESDVGLLEARRVDLENKIKLEERRGLQRLQEVRVWLLRVEAIQSQVRDLLDAKTVEVERLSMCGYCSNDLLLTYRYGKKVCESLEKVKGFLSSKGFEVVTWEGLPPDDMDQDPHQSTTGLPSDVEEEPSQSTISLPSDIDEDPFQSTTGLPPSTVSLLSNIKEDPSQSTTGLPLSDIEEYPSQSTTGLCTDIEEDLSQSITGLPSQSTFSLPSQIEEDLSQCPTALPRFGIEEYPSQPTIDLTFDIEKDISECTTGFCPDIEEDPSQSTTGQPSSVEEDPSQSTTVQSLDMEEGPIQSIIGLENMLEAIWKRLMEDEVGIFGLYGMSGIGKTTLLKQIEKKFLEKGGEFDEVIFVVVSQDLHIGRIQKEIAKRLSLFNKKWKQKSKEKKASDIKKVLTRKRFVMLLDDIWGNVELEEIGIPLPSTQNRSKVIYTTRWRNVCGSMGPDDMEVKCLSPESAWNLFRQKVRASTLASDPRILELARKVCEECNGLPLALNVIGATMACKMAVHEWQHAIKVLKSNVTNYTTEDEEGILKILKFSYDDLEDERVKQCFKYCALFPKDYGTRKDMLVEYWISEGFINEGGKKQEALNQGYAIINILIDACLLINLDYGETVTMHDVIRQMALWIASNFGEEKENFVVKSGAGQHQMPEVENWNAVRRMSLENNQIQTITVIPDCPNLTTLFLRKNKLVKLSGECFLSMPKLVVLDLSWNKHLNKLPEEVSMLVSLRYLGLARTALEELPMGLKELIQLRHLDLDGVTKLQSISVISSLLNLETLKVFGSTPLSLESIEDIKLLENLKFLSVTIVELSILECFLSIPRLASCTQDLLVQLGGFEAENISLAATAASLRILFIIGGSISYLMEDTKYGSRSPSTVTFQNLTCVGLDDVSGIQDLTWLMFAPSLTVLMLKWLTEVREIISREKVSRMINGGSSIIPFQKLQTLDIQYLLELTSMYWDPLVFPVLETINVRMCLNLKKLPLNKESSKENQLRLYSSDKEWRDRLEWEDEEIKNRLLSMYQVAPYTSALQLARNLAPSSCSIM